MFYGTGITQQVLMMISAAEKRRKEGDIGAEKLRIRDLDEAGQVSCV